LTLSAGCHTPIDGLPGAAPLMRSSRTGR